MGLITIMGYSVEERENAELLRARMDNILKKEVSAMNNSSILGETMVVMVVPSLAQLPGSLSIIRFIEFDNAIDNSDVHRIFDALNREGIRVTPMIALGPRRYVISE